MKLSAAIMHCSSKPDRPDLLKRLIPLINKDLLSSFSIHDDVDKKGIWWNYKQALNAHNDSDYHLVLQDDMIPCKNFIETIIMLINKKPDEIIHYFCGFCHADLKEGWNHGYGGVWGSLVVLPKKYYNWYLRKDYNKDNNLFEECRFNFFSVNEKIRINYISPSLVRHLGKMEYAKMHRGEINFIEDGLQLKNLDKESYNVGEKFGWTPELEGI